jgi:excisionase family DNA binding protein
MVAELIPPSVPSPDDIALARKSAPILEALLKPLLKQDDAAHPLRLLASDGNQPALELPAAAARLLLRLLDEMAQGNAVTLIPMHADLTTQQAADFLGVSRPFVIKEIEEGRLPARKVGTHRRVLFRDLLDYRARKRADQQRALDELSRLSQEMGLE